MLNVVILGSTGSLGRQTLEIFKKYRRKFKVIALSANHNRVFLKEQKHALADSQKFSPIALLASTSPQKEFCKLATLKNADIVINVLPGTAGIKPSLAALKAGKILLLGNKESLVAEGRKVMKLVNSSPAGAKSLIPLDSEHNAIYEILRNELWLAAKQNRPPLKIKSITLPCSGGPLFTKSKKELVQITAKDALKHPKWSMGDKISIESATLINKGLEIIEAHYLFKLPLSGIKVIYHPQCKIHGIVELEDGKSYAYFAKPDMKEHIENALLRAADLPLPKRKVAQINTRKFQPIVAENQKTLPGISIVLRAFRARKNMKKFLEKEQLLIAKFLEGKIQFLEIFDELKKL